MPIFIHKCYTLTYLQHFFNTCCLFKTKMEPVCVINNFTIATADDITTLSDDVNIYPVDLSGTINTLGNDLNWWEKCIYFRPIFFQFVVSHFGNSPMATECTLYHADVGDEYHYILSCKFFKEIRSKFIPQSYFVRPNTQKCKNLMNSENSDELRKLCQFINIVNASF